MSTFPRSVKAPSVALPSLRAPTEFDAGLNSSNAWTEHLEREFSNLVSSDEEKVLSDDLEAGRLARALFTFDGNADFRELCVEAGANIIILQENVADGWSLAKYNADIGLIPRTYYAFDEQEVEALGEITTPRASICSSQGLNASDSSIPSLFPQDTGEWFRALPSIRRSILGGRTFNRFSGFVTSGAEEWILNGADVALCDRESSTGSGPEREDAYYVDVGPSWRSSIPVFTVEVHSPEKRIPYGSATSAYTVYNVTSVFSVDVEESEAQVEQAAPTSITVLRRFSQFVFLHNALSRRLPGIALPPLPEKQYSGRFSEAFVEARRNDLQRYLNRIVRHPLARQEEVVTFFLGCDSDLEWERQLPYHTSLPPAGPSFYAQIYHPAFYFDTEDAEETVARIQNHLKASDNGVQQLRENFAKVRVARLEMAKSEKLLSYSLLSLITSTPIGGRDSQSESMNPDEEICKSTKGLMNTDGAWCWRDDCSECLRLTKRVQRTAETLQGIARDYDAHARYSMLNSHDSLKDVSHLSTIYTPVVETHREAVSRFKSAAHDDKIASRCETVINATMAEFDNLHCQKKEDFERISKGYLDAEIQFYEKILTRLRMTRRLFDMSDEEADAMYPGPRMPSIYEKALGNPELSSPPLPDPSPYVLDSSPMRPVSSALQGGVNGVSRLFS